MLENFQKLKYNCGDEWDGLKHNYRIKEYAARKKAGILFRQNLFNSRSHDELTDALSKYGKSNKAEFFAEVFANSQLSKPNELGKVMNVWLERKGLILK